MPHMKPAWSSRHLLIRCIRRRRQLVSRPFISRVRAKLEGTLWQAGITHPPAHRACVSFGCSKPQTKWVWWAKGKGFFFFTRALIPPRYLELNVKVLHVISPTFLQSRKQHFFKLHNPEIWSRVLEDIVINEYYYNQLFVPCEINVEVAKVLF